MIQQASLLRARPFVTMRLIPSGANDVNPTILVVDDEPAIVELTQMYLEKDGYTVLTAKDGQEALEKARAEMPDLVVLDLMLPELDGWEVCRRLRAETNIPVIMLTARADDVDKIVGLELGADDYVTKPFNPRELTARVKAVLRRTQNAVRVEALGDGIILLGDVAINIPSREVKVKDELKSMRLKEFELLRVLVEHAGIVLSRDQLLDQVWGYDFYGETRTVDVHIAHLRNKLADSEVGIETVWGIGYKLVY